MITIATMPSVSFIITQKTQNGCTGQSHIIIFDGSKRVRNIYLDRRTANIGISHPT